MMDVFARRRARVLEQLGAEGALVVAAGPELVVGPDGEVRYTPAADVYYLTGCEEPGAVAVLAPSADAPYTLFLRARDPERERWSGPRGGVEAATTRYSADRGYDVAELSTRLKELLAGCSVLYAPLDPGRDDVASAVSGVLRHARRERPRSGRGVHTVVDPSRLLAPMRLRKDDAEIAALRRAAALTVESFREVLPRVRELEGEWQVEAALEYAFRSRGASGPAFTTIAAAGANATVLHYTANAAPLRGDELLLLDGGARVGMYCADITRTVPVSGRFGGAQRAVYDVVLAAHNAAAAAAVEGATASAPHDGAVNVLVAGMRELKLLRESTDEIMEKKLYRAFYPHRTSHWLGLDVHDAGGYVDDAGAPLRLEAGMVLTIEPGLYVPADAADAPPALRGVGVRLEDDVVITAGGHEVLTEALPIRADDVEAMT